MTPEQRTCTGWSCTGRRTASRRRSTRPACAKHPVRVLNEVLLPAMKEVGDKFGAGELILPFVLQSAEVMKKAVKHLEQFLERAEGYTKGRVVLATVYGDVHDIGKSLVNTILSNNGYTVFDLGKQVPVNTIIDKAIEVNADAIGLSALLVSTSKQMPLCVQELDRRGLKIPGADRRRGDQPPLRAARAVRRRRARVRAGRVLLQGRVRGARDDGPSAGRRRVARRSSRSCSTTRATTSSSRRTSARTRRRASPAARAATSSRDNPVPTAPFFGARTLDDIPLDEVFALLDLDELYRLQWGGRGSGPEFEATVRDEFEPTLARLKESAKRDGWLKPRAVYGLFPVQAQRQRPRRLRPRRVRERRHARARSRASTSRARKDASVSASPTTSAPSESRRRRRRGVPDRDGRRRGDASAFKRCRPPASTPRRSTCTASRSKRRKPSPSGCIASMRHDLGVPAGQGKRYSWGYGACPDLEDHAQLFKLLPAERELGMELTSAFQLIPEQSTAAIIVHHPQAKYYAVRVRRREHPRVRPHERHDSSACSTPNAIIVFDGAMGTMLYGKGVFINQCYDELNVRAPDLVREIHRAVRRRRRRGASRRTASARTA